jgi:hypothetical protein
MSNPTFLYSKELSVSTFKDKRKIEYSGPVAAQMILDFLHGWGGKPHVIKEEIYRIIKIHNLERSLFTNPVGLAKCLNQLGSKIIRWRVYSGSDGYQERATRKIIDNIDTCNQPSAALIDRGNRWIVVCGFKIKKSVSESKSYEIIDVRIRNPESKEKSRVIPYKEWISRSIWFSKNVKGKKWKNKYVIINPIQQKPRKRKAAFKQVFIK